MARILTQNHLENGERAQFPAQPEITISPYLLWVIVSIAAIFFISGILHVLLKFFTKPQTCPLISQSNRYTELSRPHSLGRQLQQLFRLQDSGLDPSVIENLPVFDYKHVNGLKGPFDCAVCLCEFSPHDKLRLIPHCSHAFHTCCIDTWLLSNSTCPLCRVNLSMENSLPTRNGPNGSNGPMENFLDVSTNSVDRVLSVRLGKIKSVNDGIRSKGEEISRCNLDARRCFSTDSFQYVVNNTDLQVAMCNIKDSNLDERKIKYDSFSVSKVWMWSKKDKFSVSSLENEVGGVLFPKNYHK